MGLRNIPGGISVDNLQVTKRAEISGSLEVIETFSGEIKEISSDYSAQPSEIILADASGGPITISLPDSPEESEMIRIKKTDSTSNTITIDGNGLTIDGDSTKNISVQYESLTFISNGSDWFVF